MALMPDRVEGLAGLPFDRVWFVARGHVDGVVGVQVGVVEGPKGGSFVAWCHKFPGLVFRGFSLTEAVLMLRRYNVLNG